MLCLSSPCLACPGDSCSGGNPSGMGSERNCAKPSDFLRDTDRTEEVVSLELSHESHLYDTPQQNSIGHLGTRFCQYVDGHFLRDDPQPATAVHGRHPWCQRIGRRRDRRSGRIDGTDRQGVLGCDQRLSGQAQRAGRIRLCLGCLDQAPFRSRTHHRHRAHRASVGSHRQRRARCAA